MEKEDVQAAVIDTTNVSTPAAVPIVIKIEMPKDAEKQKNDNSQDDAKKSTKSRCCQLLPVLLFLVTFATVLSLLIVYLDPSSEYFSRQLS
jgi:hypothetical protein